MTQGQHSLWSLDPHVPSAPLPPHAIPAGERCCLRCRRQWGGRRHLNGSDTVVRAGVLDAVRTRSWAVRVRARI